LVVSTSTGKSWIFSLIFLSWEVLENENPGLLPRLLVSPGFFSLVFQALENAGN